MKMLFHKFFENNKSILWVCSIFSLYTLIALVLFRHRVFLLGTHYGLSGVDTDGTFWYYWARLFSEQNNINFIHSKSLIAFPFGFNFSNIPYFSLIYELHIILMRILGGDWQAILTVANISTLLSYPLSSISMYFLCYYLTRNKYASYLGGLLFGFSYYHVFMIGGSLSLNHIELIPLYFLSLFYYADKKSINSFLISLGIFVLMFGSNAYWAFFSGLFSVPLFYMRLKNQQGSWIKLFFSYYFLLFLLLFSTNIEYFYQQFYNFNSTLLVSNKAININNELLNPSVYFTPDKYSFLYSWGTNNAAIFTGYIPLIFLFLGFLKRKISNNFYLFFFLFILTIILSSKTFVFSPLNELYFKLFGMFRAVSRMNILGSLFLGAIMSIVYSSFKIKHSLIGTLIIIFLTFGIIFENINSSSTNYKTTNFSEIAKLYLPLKTMSDINTVVSYPIETSYISQPANYKLLGQIIHEKTLVNGLDTNSLEAKDFIESIQIISEGTTIGVLEEYGVDAIIIYNNFYPNSKYVVDTLKSDSRLTHLYDVKTNWDNSQFLSQNELSRDISVFKINNSKHKLSNTIEFYNSKGNFSKISPYKYKLEISDIVDDSHLVLNEPCGADWRIYPENVLGSDFFCDSKNRVQILPINKSGTYELIYAPYFVKHISAMIRNVVLFVYILLFVISFWKTKIL